MTKEQFVKRWQCHLAGLALFGRAGEINDGPLVRASRALEIPAEVQRLLGQMYEDATAAAPTPLPSKK